MGFIWQLSVGGYLMMNKISNCTIRVRHQLSNAENRMANDFSAAVASSFLNKQHLH